MRVYSVYICQGDPNMGSQVVTAYVGVSRPDFLTLVPNPE